MLLLEMFNAPGLGNQVVKAHQGDLPIALGDVHSADLQLWQIDGGHPGDANRPSARCEPGLDHHNATRSKVASETAQSVDNLSVVCKVAD